MVVGKQEIANILIMLSSNILNKELLRDRYPVVETYLTVYLAVLGSKKI